MPTPILPEQSIKLPPGADATKPVSVASLHPPIAGYTDGAMPAVNGESSSTGAGVFGRSKISDGVHGESSGTGMSAVAGLHMAGGNGVYGRSTGNAGCFDGNVQVNGNITVTGDVTLTGADCAEQFAVTADEELRPGEVLVIRQDGLLERSAREYDRRVAGVVAAAGDFKPGIILDSKPRSRGARAAVSLFGKVSCFADAGHGPITPGDLLTTSNTPGHVMRASDDSRSAGSIVGKALGALPEGRGLIPMLVTLK
jgi:hypothetical protein